MYMNFVSKTKLDIEEDRGKDKKTHPVKSKKKIRIKRGKLKVDFSILYESRIRRSYLYYTYEKRE